MQWLLGLRALGRIWDNGSREVGVKREPVEVKKIAFVVNGETVGKMEEAPLDITDISPIPKPGNSNTKRFREIRPQSSRTISMGQNSPNKEFEDKTGFRIKRDNSKEFVRSSSFTNNYPQTNQNKISIEAQPIKDPPQPTQTDRSQPVIKQRPISVRLNLNHPDSHSRTSITGSHQAYHSSKVHSPSKSKSRGVYFRQAPKNVERDFNSAGNPLDPSDRIGKLQAVAKRYSGMNRMLVSREQLDDQDSDLNKRIKAKVKAMDKTLKGKLLELWLEYGKIRFSSREHEVEDKTYHKDNLIKVDFGYAKEGNSVRSNCR